jgi:uncharacterized protein (DUF305 family)
MRIAAALSALAIATVVSSCSGADATHDEQPHNGSDVTFAQNMIPHHRQAVVMSAMVPTKSMNRDLIVIAKDIGVDQQAQLDTLTEWLTQWGEPVAPDHGGHAGHSGMIMEGMVDEGTMHRLQLLSGADFDALWIRSMIFHHEGAVAMAQTEIAEGLSPDAVRMAKNVVRMQQWEISRLNHLLMVPE